jgi:Cytochrome P450
MTRAVIQDFTFSDGTTVPKGSYVLAPMYAMYLDDNIYPNASTFDAFRFSKLRDQPGHENTTSVCVYISDTYQLWPRQGCMPWALLRSTRDKATVGSCFAEL